MTTRENEPKDYKIQNFSLTETKNKDKMAKFQLKNIDNSETVLNCVMWNDIIELHDPIILRNGNIVNIIDSEYNEKFSNYKIKELELVEEAIIGLSEEKTNQYYNKIISLINTFENEKYKEVLLAVLTEHEELFKNSSAARQYHHNYAGGLIQHIVECISISQHLMKALPDKVDKELLLTSCISHDFGKMFEYNTDLETGITTLNENFVNEWISHLHWGFSWANQNNLPKLAHIIASHHGLKEWGALVEPQTNEAKLMHQVDMISSKLGKTNIEDLQ